MALTTASEFQRAFYAVYNLSPWPLPDGIIGADDRAILWNQFVLPDPEKNEFFVVHKPAALDRLIEQFKRKVNIDKMVCIIANRAQSEEDVLNDLTIFRALTVAEGVQLDGIGDLVGQPRNSTNDDIYRSTIITRIFLNNRSGEPEILMAALRFFARSQDVSLTELFPANLQMFAFTESLPTNIINLMQPLTMAGIGNIIIIASQTTNESDIFSWQDESAASLLGNGWNEITAGVDGNGDSIPFLQGGLPVGGSYSEAYEEITP